MSHSRQPCGFTLLELLTALVIVAMILLAVGGAFHLTSEGSYRCQTRLALWQEADSLSQKLCGQLREIPRLTPDSLPDERLLSIQESSDGVRLDLVTRHSLWNSKSGGLVMAHWLCDAGKPVNYYEEQLLNLQQASRKPSTDKFVPLTTMPVILDCKLESTIFWYRIEACHDDMTVSLENTVAVNTKSPEPATTIDNKGTP